MDPNNPMNNMQSPMQAPAPKKHSILAPIVIIAVIVIAVLLVLGMMRNKQEAALDDQIQQKQADIATSDAQVQALQKQGTSNDPSAIQADINATTVNSIDAQ